MDRGPALGGQEVRRPMPSYHKKQFDPRSISVNQKNEKSGRGKRESSFSHENTLKRVSPGMDAQYHRPMRHRLWEGSSGRRQIPSNRASGTQEESHIFTNSSGSGPGILQKNGSGPLPAPDDLDEPEVDTSMLRQPETRPISHDQLVVEVKGIYAGLVMVEAKYIEMDERQKLCARKNDYASGISADQWRSLIALHKQLLYEHHDFFLASQHPSASNNLSMLAAKYVMPARMWRHGIHGFLEVLRRRLPESLEHMLAFIYIAYNMMALLFETVPSFEDTWIECLGDLGRYRMAIEDDEPKDHEIWSNVARHWYSKASDESPTTGKLYHQLATLARPNALEHLSLYTRALTCIVPFEPAKRSNILTLLSPVLSGKVSVTPWSLRIEILYMKAYAILFTQRRNQFNEVVQLSHSKLHDFLYHRDEKGRDDNVRTRDDRNSKNREESWTQAVLAFIDIISVFTYSWYSTDWGQNQMQSPIDDIEKSAAWRTIFEYKNGITTGRTRASCSGSLLEYFKTRSIDFKRALWEDLNSASVAGDALTAIICKNTNRTRPSASLQRVSSQCSPILNMFQRIVLLGSLIQATVAMPTDLSRPEPSAISSESLYIGLLYILSAGLFIGVAQYVSRIHGQVTTHGIAMGVRSLGWWLIANDDATSKGLRSM